MQAKISPSRMLKKAPEGPLPHGRGSVALIGALLLLLSGCAKKEDSGTATRAEQAAARAEDAARRAEAAASRVEAAAQRAEAAAEKADRTFKHGLRK